MSGHSVISTDVLASYAAAGAVGAEVQAQVAEVLLRMADVRPDSVEVVVDEFAPPAR